MRERNDFGQADYSSDYGYDPDRRVGYRVHERDEADRDDYGQADYDRDFAYDPTTRRGYRRDGDEPARRDREPRSWFPRGGRQDSDRVLWAVIAGRMEHTRGLDVSDIDLIVRHGEVTLNGTVRRREDKRLAEDIADIRSVRHVQNNLRVRDRGGWLRGFGL
jgi:hypothetical protein